MRVTGGPPPRFGVFDADGDGFITAGEFDAVFGGSATRTAPAATTAFDRTWTGSLSSGGSDCIPFGDMKLHVASGKITGDLAFNSRRMGSLESSVSGQVNPDGSAALRFEPKNASARSGGMRGTFSESRFTGSMDGSQCTYAVNLSKQ